ncbi:hypothetical protein ACQ856_18290 [Mycolicibacterium psychrotolerans]|uniref:hypothetical protein n=1 Tax=Mycolicibacterium psychrotolerans TaxID=216929 RepID=UPI003D670FD1
MTATRECCGTETDMLHVQNCPTITGPHRFSHTTKGAQWVTAHCMCGERFTEETLYEARMTHGRHARNQLISEHLFDPPHPDQIDPETGAVTYENATPISPAPDDVYDATNPDGITQLPAVTTNFTPDQFKAWLAADGDLFMVILPTQRTFVLKVPAAHHEFFVAMMQQVRFALGPEVQAVRMNVVTGDPAAADGKAESAPQWAQPQPPVRHVECTGDEDCAAPLHVHGCYADIDGPCNDPTEHHDDGPESGLSAEHRAARDKLRAAHEADTCPYQGEAERHDTATYQHVPATKTSAEQHIVTCICGEVLDGGATKEVAYKLHDGHAKQATAPRRPIADNPQA